MSQCSAGANAANSESANQVGETNNKADSEDVVCSELSVLPGDSVSLKVLVNGSELVLQDDSDNDTVNSDCLTEND